MKTFIFLLILSVSNTYAKNNIDTNNITDTNYKKQTVEQLVKTVIGTQIWNLDTISGMSELSNPLDRLGEALSHGDYNGDGFQDLAIGIPLYDVTPFSLNNVGAVLILYGTANGLSSDDSHLLFQFPSPDAGPLASINGIEENDRFGTSLASGDFNCDGITDLAVGTPRESVTIGGAIRNNVGVVNIFYGDNDGLDDSEGSDFLFQSAPENGDFFGWSMTTGQFNGSSCIDLAISAPFEDLGPITDAGVVYVYYGIPTGLTGANRDILHQDTPGVVGLSESLDQFGRSLATGNFRANNFHDLVVGIPGENTDGETNAGAVQIFNGKAGGFESSIENTIRSQAGVIVGVAEEGDRFGSSLAIGDFNNDGAEDLAVGVPFEDLNSAGINNAGAVNIIYGSASGLVITNSQIFHLNTTGIEAGAGAEQHGWFGEVLTSGADLNYDGYHDLVIGIPRKSGGWGAFLVLHGGADGLTTVDSIYQPNLIGGAADDEMGFAITVADFGNGPELAVGVPGDNPGDNNDAGSVWVYEFENPDVIFENSFEED